MIDFIIYEKDYQLNEHYKNIIYNFLGCKNDEFKIYNYDEINKSISSNKIYIIESPNIKHCLKLVQEIREKDDWYSQIIILNSNTSKLKNNHLLILDIISPNHKNSKLLLIKAITKAYNILTSNKPFKYLLNGEINISPYRDILFIEKGNNQNYCTIFTKNKKYIVKDTINNLEIKLDNIIFMKTHRSCIVNLNNITSYNYSENIIFFNQIATDLISRERRKYLKQHLLTHQINF